MTSVDADNVVLISSDGKEFTVTEKEAKCSGMIARMLENSNFVESRTRRVTLPTVNAEVLEVIVRYFKYKLKYQDSPEVVPEFDIEPKLMFDVLRTANYLQC